MSPSEDDLLIASYARRGVRRSPGGEAFFDGVTALALLDDADTSGYAVTGIETFDWDSDSGDLWVRLDWLMVWSVRSSPTESWEEYRRHTLAEARKLLYSANSADDLRPKTQRLFVIGLLSQ